MSSSTGMAARFERWIDRLLATDQRYVCGACDDRFASRGQGAEHVLRCHPEYAGVLVYDGNPQLDTVHRPARLPSAAGLRPAVVAVHSLH